MEILSSTKLDIWRNDMILSRQVLTKVVLKWRYVMKQNTSGKNQID